MIYEGYTEGLLPWLSEELPPKLGFESNNGPFEWVEMKLMVVSMDAL